MKSVITIRFNKEVQADIVVLWYFIQPFLLAIELQYWATGIGKGFEEPMLIYIMYAAEATYHIGKHNCGCVWTATHIINTIAYEE